MSLWRHLTRGLRVLTARAASDQDLSEEAQHYVDQTTEEFIARGLSPEEARRAARLECGAVSSIREEVREHGWENTVETFFADLRFALRHLRANPGFTAVTVFTLALGIGAATAIFSAVNPILFESLPYPEASGSSRSGAGVPTAAQRRGIRRLSRDLPAHALIRVHCRRSGHGNQR